MAKAQREDDEMQIDMTPMIDIIFLLLIFFILTSKFVPDEKFLVSILPTDKGTASVSASPVEKEEIHIRVYPAQFTPGHQPSVYDKAWKDTRDVSKAKYQIGNLNFIEISGADLMERAGTKVNSALDNVHGYITTHLATFEQGGVRKDLPPIIIHGFTGLPWKYVLVAYDAVRAYENRQGSAADDVTQMQNAREVNFAPPRVRQYREWEMGYELWEILNTK